MAFPAMQAQILLDALAASDYSAYLVAYRPGSLPLQTIPDRATRLLLGEVAGDPARQEPGGAEGGQVGFQSSLVLYSMLKIS